MRRLVYTLSLPLLLLLIGCASSRGDGELALEGLASWYGEEMAGRTTANGEIFDPRQLSAAHRTLAFGTLVRVTNDLNGRSVVVRINDRGPFIEKRIIDLSWAAANEIGMVEAGVVPVRLEIVQLAETDELPRPYVVRVEQPAKLIEIPTIPEDPPSIAFPLPDTVGDADVPDRPRASRDEVVAGEDISVLEERGGSETRQIVSSDGATLIMAEAPPAVPKRVDRDQGEQLREESNRTDDPTTGPELVDQQAPFWVVQIGAFRSRENADRIASRASAIGERIMIVEIGETSRVQVGPFLSEQEAREAEARLREAGFETLVMERR